MQNQCKKIPISYEKLIISIFQRYSLIDNSVMNKRFLPSICILMLLAIIGCSKAERKTNVTVTTNVPSKEESLENNRNTRQSLELAELKKALQEGQFANSKYDLAISTSSFFGKEHKLIKMGDSEKFSRISECHFEKQIDDSYRIEVVFMRSQNLNNTDLFETFKVAVPVKGLGQLMTTPSEFEYSLIKNLLVTKDAVEISEVNSTSRILTEVFRTKNNRTDIFIYLDVQAENAKNESSHVSGFIRCSDESLDLETVLALDNLESNREYDIREETQIVEKINPEDKKEISPELEEKILEEAANASLQSAKLQYREPQSNNYILDLDLKEHYKINNDVYCKTEKIGDKNIQKIRISSRNLNHASVFSLLISVEVDLDGRPSPLAEVKVEGLKIKKRNEWFGKSIRTPDPLVTTPASLRQPLFSTKTVSSVGDGAPYINNSYTFYADFYDDDGKQILVEGTVVCVRL